MNIFCSYTVLVLFLAQTVVLDRFITCWLRTGWAADWADCIAEKFYRFSPYHTACFLPVASASKSGVSASDKTLIVDKHNELRALQPATDMQKMVWDDEVAAIAQRWTDNCAFEHDAYRNVPGRFSVGQNLAAGHSSWSHAIQGWYDEIDDFTYGGSNSLETVGHYTQLVWADSARIGCGYTYCENLSYKHFYACNYAVAGNVQSFISQPYTQGSKCADCPNSCNNGLCDCDGKVCENGGELNLDTCESTCTKAWHLEGNCAMDCDAVVEPATCADGEFWGGTCFIYSNALDECPVYCNVCPYSDYTSPTSTTASTTTTSTASTTTTTTHATSTPTNNATSTTTTNTRTTTTTGNSAEDAAANGGGKLSTVNSLPLLLVAVVHKP